MSARLSKEASVGQHLTRLVRRAVRLSRASRPNGWKRVVLVGFAAFVCLLFVTGCAYHWMAARALNKEVSTAARDAETGVLLGAEPLSLGTGNVGILLIHGFIGSPKDFGDLPQRLAAAGYRVSVPLLPGHGTRPQDLLAEDEDTWFAAAENAYGELWKECEWVAVVGFSMGGTLAARLAVEAERPPDALVLASPFFGVTYRWYAVLPPATWNRILMPILPYVIKGTTFVQVNRREVASEIVSYRAVPTYAIHCLSRLAADVREEKAGPSPERMLLLYAARDGAASPRQIRKTAGRWAIPEASRVVLANSNHHIFWDFDRERAIEAVLEFIKARRQETTRRLP